MGAALRNHNPDPLICMNRSLDLYIEHALFLVDFFTYCFRISWDAYSESTLAAYITSGAWDLVEQYVLRYMPQYDAVDAYLVHANLFLVIRRGILVKMVKTGSGDAQNYFGESIQKFSAENAPDSPFVNKYNLIGQVNVITNVMRKGKLLGHHTLTDGLVSYILDYMRLHFASYINANDTRPRFYQFFRTQDDEFVRCMSCQRLFTKNSVRKSSAKLISRHFTSRTHACKNLTRNVVYRYKVAYPEDNEEIIFQSEVQFDNVSDETVADVILPSGSSSAGLQGQTVTRDMLLPGGSSSAGHLEASDNPASSNVSTRMEETTISHIMEGEDDGVAEHPPVSPSTQD